MLPQAPVVSEVFGNACRDALDDRLDMLEEHEYQESLSDENFTQGWECDLEPRSRLLSCRSLMATHMAFIPSLSLAIASV